MNIGIDVDGVLTDFEWFIDIYGSKYLKSIGYSGDIIAPEEYVFSKKFGCTDKNEVGFYKKYLLWYINKMPIRENAAQTIKVLKEQKHCRIFIITARVLADKNGIIGSVMKAFLKRWLKKNKVPYDEIHFVNTSNSAYEKSALAKRLKLDYFIEDDPRNIAAIKKHCKVICMRAKYNEGISDVFYANDFGDVYHRILDDYIQPLSIEERSGLDKNNLTSYFQQLKKQYSDMPFDSNMYEKYKKNYKTIFPIGAIIAKLTGLKWQGNENIPVTSGAIFVCNHKRWSDIPLAYLMLGKTFARMLEKKEYASTSLKHVQQPLGTIYVDRYSKTSGRCAQTIMIQTLLNGGNIFIFPEGTRNRTDQLLLPFKYGAVYIAQVTGCPIIPLALYKKGRKNYIYTIGKTVYVHPTDSLVQKNQELSNIIRNNLVHMRNSCTKLIEQENIQ